MGKWKVYSPAGLSLGEITALFALMKYLHWESDRESVSLLIFLDLSVAFLLKRLAELCLGIQGFWGMVLTWLSNFTAKKLLLGHVACMPQDICLTLHANFYMRPLEDTVCEFELRCYQYVVETHLCFFITAEPNGFWKS